MPAGLYFYPRPPRGGRPAAALNAAESLAFLSTPSARRATPFDGLYPISRGISIHALREEGDQGLKVGLCNRRYFYPRPPRGGRLLPRSAPRFLGKYFYPRPPRGGRPIRVTQASSQSWISIHALREEGDETIADLLLMFGKFLSTPSARRATCAGAHIDFRAEEFLSTPSARRATRRIQLAPEDLQISIHALREEGDAGAVKQQGQGERFLSTPSARRATHRPQREATAPWNFYPRPPRGGRRANSGHPAPILIISIHALREEGDDYDPIIDIETVNFYPRPPRGGRPDLTLDDEPEDRGISIHALREEGDWKDVDLAAGKITPFLSTPSARRATSTWCSLHWPVGRFLSTPSARRATNSAEFVKTQIRHFYPRPPRGGRHGPLGGLKNGIEISIHALREEGDTGRWGG